MPKFVPISVERHRNGYWRRGTSYSFAKQEVLFPIYGAELPRAALSNLIALVPQKEVMIPVMVMGLYPGQNVYVRESGDWGTSYVPAELRAHPFKILNTTDGQPAICVDESSGLLSSSDNMNPPEPLLTSSGELAAGAKQMLNLLLEIDAERVVTQAAIGLLRDANLIIPWPIDVGTPESPDMVHGLFRVDERAMNLMPASAFSELRTHGALALAYAQLLSIQHLDDIKQRVRIDRETALARVSKSESPLGSPFFEGDTIRF